MSEPVIIDQLSEAEWVVADLTPALSYEEREDGLQTSVQSSDPYPASPATQGRSGAVVVYDETDAKLKEDLARDATLALLGWGKYMEDCRAEQQALSVVKVIDFIQRVVNLRYGVDGMWAWCKLYVKKGAPSAQTVALYRFEVGDFLLWSMEHGIDPLHASEVDITAYRSFLQALGAPLAMSETRRKWLGERKGERMPQPAYTAATVARKLTIIRVFFEMCIRRRIMVENPAKYVDLPGDATAKIDRIKARTMSLREYDKLIDSFNLNRPDDIRDYCMTILMAVMGLRVSEVEALELSDVQRMAGDAGVLTIRHAKGNKDRTLPLIEEVLSVIDRWLAVRNLMHVDHARLFVSMRRQDRGAALEKRAIRSALDYRLNKLGIKRPGVSCHSLRHLMATEAVRNNVPLPALQQFLGHSDIATTMIYPDVVMGEQNNPAKFAAGLARRML